MGPCSRQVLQSLTNADVGNDAFPFSTVAEIDVAGIAVLALRISYVGELGWELHVPTEYATHVYEAVLEAGEVQGIKNVGYRAIETLRLEKGYCAWGAELTPDHTPLEAGLGWAVKLGQNIDFIGRDALLSQREEPLPKRLVGVSIEDPSITLLGRETILRNGERVGWLTSAGYGYTLGKSIGYGYVRHTGGVTNEFLAKGHYELEVASRRVKCTLHLKALYDPKMERIKR